MAETAERSTPRHGWGFAASIAALWAIMAFSTLPSPLYAIYAERDGFSSLIITVIYAAYAVGVMVSLVFASHLSDYHGRRPHLLVAIGLAAVSAVVFVVWPALPGLFVARVLCGLAVGLAASTGTAAITEHHRLHRPSAAGGTAQLASGMASLGGLGLGALIGGLLAEYVALPLVVPYIVFVVVLVAAAILVTVTPESRPAQPRPPYRPQRVSVPADARGRFFAALSGIFFGFAVSGMFIGLSGTFLSTVLHLHSAGLAGATVFAVFAVGIALLSASMSWPLRRLLGAGIVLLIAGLAVVVVAAWLPTPSLALFLVGGGIVGGGASAVFKGTLGTVVAVAPPDLLGETLAGFYLAGYIGLSIPVVVLGVAVQVVSTQLVLLVFAAVVAVGILAVARPLLRPVPEAPEAAEVVTPARPHASVFGRVHEGSGGEPVPRSGWTTVTLADDHGRHVDQTTVDPDGSYSLNAPTPGRYLLVCVPHGHGGAPSVAWVTLDDAPIHHDIAARPVGARSVPVAAGVR